MYNLVPKTKLDYYIHQTKHTSNKTTLYKTIMKFLININTDLVPKSTTYDLISSFNSFIYLLCIQMQLASPTTIFHKAKREIAVKEKDT